MTTYECYDCEESKDFDDNSEAREDGWKKEYGHWFCPKCSEKHIISSYDDSDDDDDYDEDDDFDGPGFGGFGGGSFGGGGGSF